MYNLTILSEQSDIALNHATFYRPVTRFKDEIKENQYIFML